MDYIDKVLTELTIQNGNNKLKLIKSIQAVCSLTKKTLNQYYTKMDYLELYRIAMGMSTFWFDCDFI